MTKGSVILSVPLSIILFSSFSYGTSYLNLARNEDDLSFNFSFYGFFAFESKTEPSQVDISLLLDTFHGSRTVFDKFKSTKTADFSLYL